MISDIQFVEFIITNIDYKVVSLEEDNEDNFEFAYGLKEVDDTYILSILTKVADVQGDHKVEITIETKGRFAFLEDCDLEDKSKENVVKTNGSAIMYPYIRALIHSISSVDTRGDVIILPTINFNKVIEDIDSNIKEEITPDENNKG